MAMIFRAMTPDGDKPKVGASARSLGVRVTPNAHPDIPVNGGEVVPNSGGMSVAPAWRELPLHRIPGRLKQQAKGAVGNNADKCWRMGMGPFRKEDVADNLTLRLTNDAHGLVEPGYRMTIGDYQMALTATQSEWQVDEN